MGGRVPDPNPGRRRADGGGGAGGTLGGGRVAMEMTVTIMWVKNMVIALPSSTTGGPHFLCGDGGVCGGSAVCCDGGSGGGLNAAGVIVCMARCYRLHGSIDVV